MTRLTVAAACAALATLSISTAAFAADPVTAKLAQPVAQPVKFIAGGAIFNCDGDTCVAQATTTETFSTASCKQVAAKVGQIAAFTGVRAMDEQRLSACNLSAKGAQVAKQ
jgi:hypothetical protein